MKVLSLKKYGWRCVLGAEVAYLVCLLGGLFPIRSGRGLELHHTIFELMPGFSWINFESVILGAGYIFISAWLFAWYYVWMHNSSLE
ncbi:MAG: hypothetical protein WC797_03010 [Candidatus Paceibacterota bacterium]|jgi:hypothetical protein